MKKSLAIIVPAINNKAPIKVALNLAKGLSGKYRITVYYLSQCDSEDYLIRGLQIKINIRKMNFNSLIKLKEFDIIHSHCIKADICAYISKFFLRSKNKWVSTLHCNPYLEFDSGRKRLVAYAIPKLWLMILKKSDHLILLNNWMSTQLCGHNNTEVIYNGDDITFSGIDKEIARNIVNFKGNKKLIGCYGVFRHVKGFDQVLKVALALKDKAYCFIIIGDGPLREDYDLFISKHKLTNIMLLGYQDSVFNFLKLFDLFLIPSRSEGFPLAIIEGFSSKVNLLVSNIPQFLELKNSVNIETYELDNITDLMRQIESSEFKKRNDFFDYYCKELTVDAMCDKYVKVFSNV